MSNSPSSKGSTPSSPQNQSEPSTSSPAPTCANCNKQETSSDPESSPELKPCISCKSVFYCSRDCKKADTKKHKKACPTLAQEYFKNAEVKMARRAPPKADAHRGGLQKWQFDT